MRLPRRPTVYETNTAVWLQRLGRERGGALTLDGVPTAEWDALAAMPVDAVWLMGVWQRSPAGLRIALADPALDAANRAALPDLRTEDVIGSPYCVRDYVVDERFGGRAALAAAREQLAARGLGLILDYVPNHVAPDHPWTTARPECLLTGTEEDLARRPEAFLRTAGGVVAKGRDPYFAPWPDVAQLNAFAPALREAVGETLTAIGEQCDGVRCDMAMLMTNEVFARTWGERAGPAPREEYWPAVIGATKAAHPNFLFLAEAYWDMEWALQQQGFDLCYDKRLYDRLAHESAESVRGHLQADAGYQERLIRFIENHDEPRAAATFGPQQARAAAVVMSTLQGARLYHDGQFEGRRARIPVFLGRGPDEPPDDDLRAFYGRLLRAVSDAGLRDGDWRLCDCEGWPDNDSHRRLVSWCWRDADSRHLVVVNLSDAPAQARVRLPWDDVAGRTWQLTDRLDGECFERSGDEIAAEGLYVALDAWSSNFVAWVGDD
ncbi:MAG TPA: alpha-amylase family glycosyl hydrolase [Solirubrobacteraceae bacterium]